LSQSENDRLNKEALAEFRADVASWLEANCPLSQRQPIVREEQIWGGRRRVFPPSDAQQWFEACRDRGFTAPEWPTEYGGAGLNAECAKNPQAGDDSPWLSPTSLLPGSLDAGASAIGLWK